MKDYLLIVLGMAIYAIGFTAFILPHEVVIGGMAGFGTLVHFATGGYVPVAVAMYVTNVLLLCCSFRLLGLCGAHHLRRYHLVAAHRRH